MRSPASSPPGRDSYPSVTHRVPVLSTGESWAPSSGKRLLEGEQPGARWQLFIWVNAYGRNVSHSGFPAMFSVSAPWHTGCRGFWQWPQQQKTPGFAASTSPQALMQLFLPAACTAVPGGARPFIRDTLPHSYLAPEEAPSLFWGGQRQQLLILAWPPACL